MFAVLPEFCIVDELHNSVWLLTTELDKLQIFGKLFNLLLKLFGLVLLGLDLILHVLDLGPAVSNRHLLRFLQNLELLWLASFPIFKSALGSSQVCVYISLPC